MVIRIFHIHQSPPTYEETIFEAEQPPPPYELIDNFTPQPLPANEFVQIECEQNPQPSDFGPNSYNLKQCFSQVTTMLGGFSLLFVSGLHIGWGIWRMEFTDRWISDGLNALFIFLVMSWYVAAIFGGIIGAFMVTYLRKKVIYCISGTILTISSIIFIIWYKQQIPILVGRVLAGIGHGIVYNVTTTHAAENADKEHRVQILSFVNVMISSAVLIAATLIALLSYGHNTVFISYRVIGIIGLFVSLLGILLTIFLNVESVQYLLRNEMEVEALIVLMKLRPKTMRLSELTTELREIKTMIAEHAEGNQNIFSSRNRLVIIYMTIITIGVSFTNNILLNWTMISLLALILGDNYKLAPVILTLVRFTVSITPFFTTIPYRIRQVLTVISGTIILIILSIAIPENKMELKPEVYLGSVLCIVFQLLVGFGIDPMQHVCISEVFPTLKRPWSVAVVTSFKNAFQVAMIGIFFIENLVSHVKMIVALGVTLCYLLVFSMFIRWPKTSINRSLKQTVADALRKVTSYEWTWFSLASIRGNSS